MINLWLNNEQAVALPNKCTIWRTEPLPLMGNEEDEYGVSICIGDIEQVENHVVLEMNTQEFAVFSRKINSFITKELLAELK